jgi:U2-associated protein SR140
VDGTPVPRKIARLHLICDILHNSAAAVPSAWKFRQEFQSRLGIVFDHFATIYHSFPGRITAETFKKQITAVIDIWEDWIVFPPDFTAELRARLDGATQADLNQPKAEDADVATAEAQSSYVSKFKAKSFQPAQDVSEAAAGPTDDTDDLDGALIEDMDVDGVPIDLDGDDADDVDGVPLDHSADIDGEPMEDIDGLPMDADDDDDVDGVPL